MTFPELLTLLLERRRFIVGVSVMLAAIVAFTSLLLPRTWESAGAFTPQTSSSNLGRFAGLAAQLGVALPGQDAGQQPSFYVELLQSNAVLRLVVDSPMVVAGRESPRTIVLRDLLGGGNPDPSVRSELAVEALRRRLSVGSTLKTGVVSMSVRTRDPDLSQAIAARLLAEVERFNLQTRQSQARQERRFLEGRLAEARDSLRSAEDALQGFLQRNRAFSSSPQLTFERNRLDRRMTERQQIVTTLAQAFEQSRIDEVRNTPLVTILQSPVRPARPARRFLLVKTILAFLGGFGFTTLVVLWQHLARRAFSDTPGVQPRLGMLWSEARKDLFQPWRLFGRRS
jgi:uncharacterized protein involved in exopolysaccharide biosynthesis